MTLTFMKKSIGGANPQLNTFRCSAKIKVNDGVDLENFNPIPFYNCLTGFGYQPAFYLALC